MTQRASPKRHLQMPAKSPPTDGKDSGNLHAQCLLALQRLDAKKEIIAQLIDGRIHLLEAAGRFRSIARSQTVGQEDAEYFCRLVIGWAHLALSERPERAEAVSQELEQELAELLTRDGSVNLPADPALAG